MRLFALFGFLLAIFMPGLSFAGDDLATFHQLVRQKHYQQAYSLGQKLSENNAGESDFDFDYGLAALEAGRPQEASFAFDRVLIRDPNNLRARLELARAYYAMQDYNGARQQFDLVQKHKIPPNVRKNVNKFLAAITLAEQRKKIQPSAPQPFVQAYLAANTGYDSNINSATSVDTISILGFQDILLDTDSTQQESAFVEMNGGVSFSVPSSENKASFGRIDFVSRHNIKSTTFDTNFATVEVGYAFRQGNYTFRFPANYQQLWLDNSIYRHVISGGAEVTRPLSPANTAGLFAVTSAFYYPQAENHALDVDQFMIGSLWAYQNEQNRFRLSNRTYYAYEEPIDDGLRFNSRHFVGTQLLFKWFGFENHTPYALFTYQHDEYNAPQPAFGYARRGDLYYAGVGWDWQVNPHWIVNATVLYANNDSNIVVYRYERAQGYLGVRYLFG